MTDTDDTLLRETHIRSFPGKYANNQYAVDIGPPGTTPLPFSFQAQIEFFEHLERELEGAWRAGYQYLTIPWRREPMFLDCMVITAQFVPHNDPDALDDDSPFTDEYTTFPVADMALDIHNNV